MLTVKKKIIKLLKQSIKNLKPIYRTIYGRRPIGRIGIIKHVQRRASYVFYENVLDIYAENIETDGFAFTIVIILIVNKNATRHYCLIN